MEEGAAKLGDTEAELEWSGVSEEDSERLTIGHTKENLSSQMD
jgi:hypothetical protein